MSASPSYLTMLPTEILEQLFLHLPGQDLIKMGAVRRVNVNLRQTVVDFTLFDLGQPTLPRPRS